MNHEEKTSILKVGFPTPLINLFWGALGMLYLEELQSYSAEDLLKLRGFGKKSLQIVRDKLFMHRISLKKSPKPIPKIILRKRRLVQ